jgi:hypothetical protein
MAGFAASGWVAAGAREPRTARLHSAHAGIEPPWRVAVIVALPFVLESSGSKKPWWPDGHVGGPWPPDQPQLRGSVSKAVGQGRSLERPNALPPPDSGHILVAQRSYAC